MKDRILNYLASGLQPAQISSILGCSPAYISQLLKDPDFKAKVEAAMIDNKTPADEALDNKYEALEHTIVKEMQAQVIQAELPHLTKALEAVTKAQDARAKRKNPGLQQATILQQVVQISVPQHAIAAPVLTLNEKSEVVAIDSKPLAPLSAGGVKALFQQLHANKEAQNALSSSVPVQQGITATPADF